MRGQVNLTKIKKHICRFNGQELEFNYQIARVIIFFHYHIVLRCSCLLYSNSSWPDSYMADAFLAQDAIKSTSFGKIQNNLLNPIVSFE